MYLVQSFPELVLGHPSWTGLNENYQINMEEDKELIIISDTDTEAAPAKGRDVKKPRRIVYSDDDSDDDGDTEDKENVEIEISEKELGGSSKSPVKVGTFADEDGMDEDDDILLSQAVDNLEQKRLGLGNGHHQQQDKEDESDVSSVCSASPSSSNTILDEDEYDKNDDFVDDDDDVEGDGESSGDETNSDFEKERDRVNDFVLPDPYLAKLNVEKKGGGKRKESSRKKDNGPRPKKPKTCIFLDSDGEEVEYSDAEEKNFTDDVQEVSIHQIKINHHKFRKILEREKNPEEKIIEYIIQKQNNVNKKNKTAKYEKKHVQNFPRMVQEDQNFFNNGDDNDDETIIMVEPFKIKIFAQIVKRSPALMTAYGVEDVTSQLCHTLIFHYRKEEIFVLTTGQAWNVVQWASDFGFPGKVAARILSREGALEVTKKGLIGTDFMSKRTHTQIQESNPYDLLTFCTGYTTQIEKMASILKLDCFKAQRPEVEVVLPETEAMEVVQEEEDELPSTSSLIKSPHNVKTPKKNTPKKNPPKKRQPSKKQSRPTTKVTVSQAAVRFLKRFRPSDFLAILNHLSLIAKGQTTKTMDGKDEEDSSAHVQYLQPVHLELARELDLELSKQVHDAIADNQYLACLQNYDFAHKHFMDFYFGHEYFLKYKKSTNKHWKNSPPSLIQVIHALRGIDDLVSVDADTSEDDYKKTLDKCKINYKTHGEDGKQKPGEKVMNFIQGMFYRPLDNKVYWHIKGLWCNLEPSYILLIQKEFLALIRQHLRDPTSLKLKYAWPRSDQAMIHDEEEEDENTEPNPYAAIEAYVEQYRDHENYFLSETPGKGIVDMIKINKKMPVDMMNQTLNETVTEDAENKTAFTLYYIISSLSHKVISQGIRVTKSLTGLRKGESVDVGSGATATGPAKRKSGVGGSEHSLEELKKLYEQVKIKPEFLQVAPTFNQFKTLLSNARIVLVIGNDSDAPLARTLEEEKNVPISIQASDVERQLNLVVEKDPSLRLKVTDIAAKLGVDNGADNFAHLATTIHALMIRNELIGGDNSITSKLVALSPISIPIVELKEYATFLNDYIIKAFQPPASTFLGKMELVRIRRHIMKLGIGQFYIAEIPLA